ncbi:Uncharacterised protein [Mycobacteroides abscessus subsp. massiliense]|nr:Uncharacterised protein [Mycobacteroides abscessus subsp. massiliense]
MGFPVALFVAFRDAHVEVVMHFVDKSDVLARELAAGTGQRLQVRIDEGLARGIEVTCGQLGTQGHGLAGQVCRIGGGLVLDTLPQRRITGEGVDVSTLNTVKSQPEQQVFVDEAVLRPAVIAHVTQP